MRLYSQLGGSHTSRSTLRRLRDAGAISRLVQLLHVGENEELKYNACRTLAALAELPPSAWKSRSERNKEKKSRHDDDSDDGELESSGRLNTPGAKADPLAEMVQLGALQGLLHLLASKVRVAGSHRNDRADGLGRRAHPGLRRARARPAQCAPIVPLAVATHTSGSRVAFVIVCKQGAHDSHGVADDTRLSL